MSSPQSPGDSGESRETGPEVDTQPEIRSAIAAILSLALEPIPLEPLLLRVLDLILRLPWLPIQARGAIFLADDASRQLILAARIGLPTELICFTEARVPYGKCVCGRAILERRAIYKSAVDAGHEIVYPGMEPHGHYCVPILEGDRRLGLLSLYLPEGHRQSPIEEQFLREVGDVLAGIIGRRRAERQLEQRQARLLAAQEIQNRLLPRSPLLVPACEIHGISFAAEVTQGDIYDFFPLPDGSVIVAVADVSGHGIEAALLMAATQARLRSYAELNLDFADLLGRINRGLYEQTAGEHFVSLLALRIEPEARGLVYANAGHPPGFVLDRAGAVRATLDSQSLPLAVELDEKFSSSMSMPIAPGDLLFLLTDGLFEASSPEGEPFGFDRALRVVRESIEAPLDRIARKLRAAVGRFRHSITLDDDLTLILARFL